MRKQRPHIRHGERASSIVEAILCMFLILLLTFGLLQFFYYSVAQMVTDYAAFRAARSVAVGFKEVIAEREAKLKAIAASGKMRFPLDTKSDAELPFATAIGQFWYERLAIIDYMEMTRDLRYDYWTAEEKKNDSDDNSASTSFELKTKEVGSSLATTATFYDYPWIMPFRGAFLNTGKLDISAEAELANHAAAFTE